MLHKLPANYNIDDNDIQYHLEEIIISLLYFFTISLYVKKILLVYFANKQMTEQLE